LARVRVDLTPKFDSAFSLNVQKSGVDVPVAFRIALDSLKSKGSTFPDFVADADDTYRDNQSSGPLALPVVAGAGIPVPVRQSIRRAFASNGKAVRLIRIRWSRLKSDRLFEVDRTAGELRMNTLYRDTVLRGTKRFESDAALTKALLFLLLRSEFERERIREAHELVLEEMNEVLVTALQQQ
jgi:hypothetical protein